jgi:hypothetical protein
VDAGPDDDPGSGQGRGPDRILLAGRPQRPDGGRTLAAVRLGRPVDAPLRTVHQLFGRPGAPRVRQPVVARLHGHGDEPAPGTETPTLAGAAYTGGADWDWRLSQAYSITGHWAGSTIQGSPEAIAKLQENNVHSFQRPDAGHVDLDRSRTSLDGHAGSLAISKIAGERVRFNSNVGFKSPGFEINDIGFLRRADQRTMGNWLQVRFDTPNRVLRNFRFNLNQWAGWNFDGDRLFAGFNVNAHAWFQSNWRLGAGANYDLEGYDDRLTRGGPGGRRPGSKGLWHYLNTDDRKPVFFSYDMFVMKDREESSVVNLNPRVTVRPTPALSGTVGLAYSQNISGQQWVKKVTDTTDHFILAHLHQRTVSFTGRLNYTMTPDLSLQLYAEPFVSAGLYSGFRELVAGRADAYEDRFAPFDYAENPDFTFKSFRTTNVLRWEYRPGSTLFIVWQQNRQKRFEGDGYGDFRFGRDFSDAFGVPGTNIFLVKLAYWLNF